jgi:4-deoxy-L-threo-5-hexosulose-uronate ketol-isomerase
MTTEELRRNFLVDSLFTPDATPMVYSDVDRSITGSAVPVAGDLALAGNKKELAAEYFLERRELGIINVGGEGAVRTDAELHALGPRDALYVGRGTKNVVFSSRDPHVPARFYFVSLPAHAQYPTVRVTRGEAEVKQLGTTADANRRTIRKYIRPPTLGETTSRSGIAGSVIPAPKESTSSVRPTSCSRRISSPATTSSASRATIRPRSRFSTRATA